MVQIQINGNGFDFPLRISTQERCSDPCPEFRERIEGSDEFEFIGMWGPFVKTANKETIAVGHKIVRVVLNTVLGGESELTGTKTCEKWNCTNGATHIVEIDSGHTRQ